MSRGRRPRSEILSVLKLHIYRLRPSMLPLQIVIGSIRLRGSRVMRALSISISWGLVVSYKGRVDQSMKTLLIVLIRYQTTLVI